MAALVDPGQRVLILMPGTLPGSVGDLLVKALARMDVQGIVHGPVNDPEAAIQTARQDNIDSLVGIPVQVLAMARHAQGPRLAGQIRTVLLSTDYVPGAIVNALQQAWGSRVFTHYGMTEMGLGGAVECAARNGCHFREADLLVEIVDPRTHQPVADGTVGEIVFTTLTREGMPLIRYRTGDLAAFKVEPCPCGTVLRTLGPVRGRGTDQIPLGRHGNLMIGELDEALFSIEDVLNYHADIQAAETTDRLSLFITPRKAGPLLGAADRIRQAVLSVPAIRAAWEEDLLEVLIRPAQEGAPASTGTTKRRIHDLRERIIHP
jgi:phenylacetate-coenzyme A ligase PaaK-like adenylate-forming protein